MTSNYLHDEDFDGAGKSSAPRAHIELVYKESLQENDFIDQENDQESNAAPQAKTSDKKSEKKSEPQPARRQKRTPASALAPPASPNRHARKCSICNHPDRQEIEELYVNWHDPNETAVHFNVPVRSIWRHARATGIEAARNGNLGAVLDRILERSWRVKITGDTLLGALRAKTCLTGDNKWLEPASRVTLSTEFALGDSQAVRVAKSRNGSGGELEIEGAESGSLIDIESIRQ